MVETGIEGADIHSLRAAVPQCSEVRRWQSTVWQSTLPGASGGGMNMALPCAARRSVCDTAQRHLTGGEVIRNFDMEQPLLVVGENKGLAIGEIADINIAASSLGTGVGKCDQRPGNRQGDVAVDTVIRQPRMAHGGVPRLKVTARSGHLQFSSAKRPAFLRYLARLLAQPVAGLLERIDRRGAAATTSPRVKPP